MGEQKRKIKNLIRWAVLGSRKRLLCSYLVKYLSGVLNKIKSFSYLLYGQKMFCRITPSENIKIGATHRSSYLFIYHFCAAPLFNVHIFWRCYSTLIFLEHVSKTFVFFWRTPYEYLTRNEKRSRFRPPNTDEEATKEFPPISSDIFFI